MLYPCRPNCKHNHVKSFPLWSHLSTSLWTEHQCSCFFGICLFYSPLLFRLETCADPSLWWQLLRTRFSSPPAVFDVVFPSIFSQQLLFLLVTNSLQSHTEEMWPQEGGRPSPLRARFVIWVILLLAGVRWLWVWHFSSHLRSSVWTWRRRRVK